MGWQYIEASEIALPDLMMNMNRSNGFPMKAIWVRGRSGDYFYYICICQKKYVCAIKIEEQIIAKVRKYCSGTMIGQVIQKLKLQPAQWKEAN